MEFRDLKKQYHSMKNEIDEAIARVCASSGFIGGQEVQELEKSLADYVGVKHCITCANGTDALQLALMAMEVGTNDAVFVPDFTFFASGEAPAVVGAKPVFVDVDEKTFNMSPDDLEKAILQTIEEGKYIPKAIIAVDLFGLPADYDRIAAIAKKYHLLILEDGAQGFGGNIAGKMACSFGDIGTTSFFPAKPLGCYGDGGAVFTDNDENAMLIRSYAVHGKGTNKYDNVRLGMNSRLDTIQAAILKIKLEKFACEELEKVNYVANRYTQELQGVVETPKIPEGYYSSWAQYTIQLSSKEQRVFLQQALKENEIPSMVYYPKPMHQQKAFESEMCSQVQCPNTEKLCDCVLQLPIHPYLEEEEIMQVCSVVKKVLAQQ